MGTQAIPAVDLLSEGDARGNFRRDFVPSPTGRRQVSVEIYLDAHMATPWGDPARWPPDHARGPGRIPGAARGALGPRPVSPPGGARGPVLLNAKPQGGFCVYANSPKIVLS